jgi:hypothetical protein
MGNACPLTPIGFGLIPFRSPLLRESRLISFPRGTEMCQFPRLPSVTYVLSDGRRRITGARFPHSEIRGSKAVQRLTAAYRSRPRPSSAPGAKASTVCPYYLDGELHPRSEARMGRIPILALVQFSSSVEARGPEVVRPRSLKTEQHRDAGRREAAATRLAPMPERSSGGVPQVRSTFGNVSLERR